MGTQWRKVDGAFGRCWAWVEGMETCSDDLNARGQCSRCLEWYRAHDMFAPGSGPERPTETARLVEVLERIAATLERLEEHHESAAGATVKAARRMVRVADWMKGPEFLEMLQGGMKAAETIEKLRTARMPKARRKG